METNKPSKYNIGDRVIYDNSPSLIVRKWNDRYILNPIGWDKNDKHHPYPNNWVDVDLIELDYGYYREQKINLLLGIVDNF